MPSIGPLELMLVLALALLVLGPKRLPGAGRAMGRGLREFRDAIGGAGRDGQADELAAGREPARTSSESAAGG
jgi:sec-independent protein translocase protein TatA